MTARINSGTDGQKLTWIGIAGIIMFLPLLYLLYRHLFPGGEWAGEAITALLTAPIGQAYFFTMAFLIIGDLLRIVFSRS